MHPTKRFICAFAVGFGILPADPVRAETSWTSAIEAVREKSDKFYSYAIDMGSGHPGSALQGYDHDRHICAITGRMLGFRKEILEAETLDEPPLSPDVDPMEIMIHAVTLDAWVAAARRAIELTENQKKSLWNLECVGKHGIPRIAGIDDPELNPRSPAHEQRRRARATRGVNRRFVKEVCGRHSTNACRRTPTAGSWRPPLRKLARRSRLAT